jgi:hypothetical protein
MTEVTQQPSIIGRLATNPAELAASRRALDYDKGVVIVHGGFQPVAYYPDQPGVYYNEAGQEVSEDEARLAGIDTLKFSAERRRKEARDKAFADIERQHQAELAAIEAQESVQDVSPNTETATNVKSLDELAADGERAHKKS